MASRRKDPLEAETSKLYGLPLGEFTASRNDLAKRLRAEGERDSAEKVKGLRKPTIPAWAVNQLVRRRGQAFEDLLEVGEALRRAQAALIAGRRGGDIQELAARERELVARLVDEARALLTEMGESASESTLEDVAETLHAVVLDPEAARDVESGRLVKERRAAGLGLGVATPSKPRPERGGAKRDREAGKRKLAAAEERLEAARSAAREARRDAEEADRVLRRAEAEAKRAARRAEQAAERERKAAEALERLG
jgi:hypothetical protein